MSELTEYIVVILLIGITAIKIYKLYTIGSANAYGISNASANAYKTQSLTSQQVMYQPPPPPIPNVHGINTHPINIPNIPPIPTPFNNP